MTRATFSPSSANTSTVETEPTIATIYTPTTHAVGKERAACFFLNYLHSEIQPSPDTRSSLTSDVNSDEIQVPVQASQELLAPPATNYPQPLVLHNESFSKASPQMPTALSGRYSVSLIKISISVLQNYESVRPTENDSDTMDDMIAAKIEAYGSGLGNLPEMCNSVEYLCSSLTANWENIKNGKDRDGWEQLLSNLRGVAGIKFNEKGEIRSIEEQMTIEGDLSAGVLLLRGEGEDD